ncbi:MAG: magnesium and cobalt transport protein CorA, partial [Streptomyces sp.]|nr:magnesium and cobalt transport protein CorA [Streptomyces sp.]
MSMIRDLRAAVRPSRISLRKDTGVYDTTRDPSTPSAVVDCAVYRDGARVDTGTPMTPHEAMRLVRRDGGFVWIGMHEPTEAEFAGIAREFGLHPLAVEDAVQAHQRPKLERYDDSLFTVFKTIHYVEHDQLTANSEVVETGEVMCFTGRDFFITVRHGGQGSLRALRHRLQDDPELLAKGPSAVLHAIADHVVDGYVAVADAVQDDIDEVETEVFSPGRRGGVSRGVDSARIYQLKREVLEFKRAVAPLLRPMQLLSERPMRLVDP